MALEGSKDLSLKLREAMRTESRLLFPSQPSKVVSLKSLSECGRMGLMELTNFHRKIRPLNLLVIKILIDLRKTNLGGYYACHLHLMCR